MFVTHDQEEALEVADRIVVMNHGRIEQVGTPSDVYDHPATPFVHEFIGQVNQLSIGMGVPAAFVRPHEIAVSISPKADAIAARLLHMASVGPTSRLEFVRLDDQRSINVELPRDAFDRLALSVRDIAYLSPTRVRQFGTGSAHSVRRPVSDPQPA